MTREELIKRLSYRGQFGQLIVDDVGIGSLLDEAIAMLETDDDIIQDLTSVVKYYQDKYKEVEDEHELLMIYGQHWKLIINQGFFPCSDAKLKMLCKYIDSDDFYTTVTNYSILYDYLEEMSVYMGKIHYKPREQEMFDKNFECIRNLMQKRGIYKWHTGC